MQLSDNLSFIAARSCQVSKFSSVISSRLTVRDRKRLRSRADKEPQADTRRPSALDDADTLRKTCCMGFTYVHFLVSQPAPPKCPEFDSILESFSSLCSALIWAWESGLDAGCTLVIGLLQSEIPCPGMGCLGVDR